MIPHSRVYEAKCRMLDAQLTHLWACDQVESGAAPLQVAIDATRALNEATLDYQDAYRAYWSQQQSPDDCTCRQYPDDREYICPTCARKADNDGELPY